MWFRLTTLRYERLAHVDVIALVFAPSLRQNHPVSAVQSQGRQIIRVPAAVTEKDAIQKQRWDQEHFFFLYVRLQANPNPRGGRDRSGKYPGRSIRTWMNNLFIYFYKHHWTTSHN